MSDLIFEKLSETRQAWFPSLARNCRVEMQTRFARWKRNDGGSQKSNCE
ncbi:MAG: hypothetical protein Q7K44_03840 [Candidatus Liptonbacteria bacterium]|nr:hypothetical protein [Candidatus Liptonbacteria bacterium]